MPVVAVIGAQWGDEGKGKVVDLLAEKAAMVVRYAGGNNAGHTVINHLGEFKMHLIPCGIFHPNPACVIASGVVVDPAVLLDEVRMITDAGLSLDGRLFVSNRAHLIMPYHIVLDGLDEEIKGQSALGTTKRGVGPAYADKYSRTGIRVGDLLDEELFLERLQYALDYKNKLFVKIYDKAPLDFDDIAQQYLEYGELLKPFITDTELMIDKTLGNNGLVILEGSQGTMLDIDYGTYPYVTSSNPTSGGGPAGAGIPPTRVDRILGVFKAYTTRVGTGPLPTELLDEMGEYIRQRAQEFGATTGRARRCGWFDAVAAKHSVRLNGFDSVALMRLDVLDELSSIKICVGYKVNGDTYTHFPDNIRVLEQCEPVYEEMPGWQAPTNRVRRMEDLPKNAYKYVKRIEELTGCPIDLVSVGPDRDETVIVKPII